MTTPIIKDFNDFYEQNHRSYFQVNQVNIQTKESRIYQTFFNPRWLGGRRNNQDYPLPVSHFAKLDRCSFTQGNSTINLNVIESPSDRWGNVQRGRATTDTVEGCFRVVSKQGCLSRCHDDLYKNTPNLSLFEGLDDINSPLDNWLLKHYQEANFISAIRFNDIFYGVLEPVIVLTTNQYFDSPDWQDFISYFEAEASKDSKLWG